MREEKRLELKNGGYVIETYIDAVLGSRDYYDKDGLSHRDNDKPSYIEFFDNSLEIQLMEYHFHGVHKRLNGEPSSVSYFDDGGVWGYSFTDESGRSHSPKPEIPSSIYCDECGDYEEVTFNQHGKYYREDDGATFIEYYYGEVDEVSYDGTRAGGISYKKLNDKELKRYDMTMIPMYKLKSRYKFDILDETIGN